MSYPIEVIAALIGAERIGNNYSMIDWLLTDSRSLAFPEETLFFALQTSRGSGVSYVSELYEQGVRNFVIQGETKSKKIETLPLENYPEANFLIVPNALKALQRLAEQHRNQYQVPVIGVTGSNGKTIVKEWLHQLLSPDRMIVRSPRSYNSQIGVPLSVWQMNSNTELSIFEAGISEPGEMQALENIIKPTIGVFTGIGGAHQENFFTIHEKCAEKLSLFRNCEIVIYNGDDEIVTSSAIKTLSSAREIAWSKVDKDKPLYISKVDKRADHTLVTYHYLGLDNTYQIPFVDEASIENSINCLGVCLYLMLPPEVITARMAHLEPVAMRLELKEGKNDCILINDTYNSDLASLDIALDFLHRRSVNKQLKRTLILSDILETGQATQTLYRKVASMIHSREVDKLIGVGDDIQAIASRFDGEAYFFPHTDALLASKVFKELQKELILIKGARSFEFDRISDALELKVHETVLEVNLSALVANLKYYQSRLKKGTKVICMLKSAAYGAGSFEISKSLQEHRADYLAVAVADEGVELRKSGITTSIIIMNPEIASLKTMFEYRLEPEVYSFYLLENLIRMAEKEGITNFPVHIKIDTGMHRLGFETSDIPQLIKRLKSQNALIPRSVFSHLVGSDDSGLDDYTREQIKLFEQASEGLQSAFEHRILRHICNSAAVERFPEAQYDMVRLGIGLYGVNPVTGSVLNNVSTLKAAILQIRDVAAGETVGYSRKGKLTRNSRIAAIRIGYGDGLNRHLGNGRAYCLINGQKAYYVGNICMDICMVDVTGIDCKEGDFAILFGDKLPITDLAKVLDTIPYEVLTAVSPRVKRVYFQD